MINESAIAPPITKRRLVYFEPWHSRRALLGQLLWFLLWLGTTGFAIYLSADPKGHGTHQQLGLPACPSTVVLNRPCPGCGLTTSFTAIVHGQVAQSIQAHPLGGLLYLLFTASALACIYGYARRWKFNTEGRSFNRAIGWLVAVFLAFGAIRFAVVSDYNGRTIPAASQSSRGPDGFGGSIAPIQPATANPGTPG
jgi:hypothetical protein